MRKAEEERKERRIGAANNLRVAIEAEERVKREMAQLQNESNEAKRQRARGVRLAMWPHLQEYEEAKKKIQWDLATFKFAVAGVAGTGKSSLINIFLDLDSKNGAPLGINETTREMTRYPDPGDMPPRKWIVWYDVPGGGTANIPQSGYFNNQSLFLMDVILVLVGDRFSEIDLAVLTQCIEFKIPSMIVRSRSDTHIDNMVKLRVDEDEVEANDALRLECRAKYIAETRDSIATQLQKASLPAQYVYLVSCSPGKPFRRAYSSFAGGAPYQGAPHFIDEMKLVHDLTITANERRGGVTPGLAGRTQPEVRDYSAAKYHLPI